MDLNGATVRQNELLSEAETRKHQARVSEILHLFVRRLLDCADKHDESKLTSPEAEIFAEYTEKLKSSTYGSDEYKSFLAAMKPALDHHYARNRHHPECHNNGVNDMTLIDLIEMISDWKSASERHNDGNILKSIEINTKRFNIDAQLSGILVNTVKFLSLVE